MKCIKLFVFLSIFSVLPVLSGDLYLIDQIEAVVLGPNETSLVTRSEIDCQGLDGAPQTKEKIILEQLIYQDGKKFNLVDDKIIERYIAAVQREHNLSLDDLKAMFNASGYDYEEGRNKLAVLQTVNSIVDYKVRSRLVVSESEVKAYYNAYPLYTEDEYHLRRFVISVKSTEDREHVKKTIEKQLHLGNLTSDSAQSEFWVNKTDLAEDKAFVAEMKVGSFSPLYEMEDGFEALKLLGKKNKSLVPLEIRYEEIQNELRKPLFDKLFAEYKQSLFDKSIIIYLN